MVGRVGRWGALGLLLAFLAPRPDSADPRAGGRKLTLRKSDRSRSGIWRVGNGRRANADRGAGIDSKDSRCTFGRAILNDGLGSMGNLGEFHTGYDAAAGTWNMINPDWAQAPTLCEPVTSYSSCH